MPYIYLLTITAFRDPKRDAVDAAESTPTSYGMNIGMKTSVPFSNQYAEVHAGR